MPSTPNNIPALTVALVAVLFVIVFGIFVIRSTRHTGLSVIMAGAIAAFLAVLFAVVVVPYLSDMQPPPPADLRPYNLAELEGKHIYLREGCWYCHSQFVRPMDRNLGPVSKASDYYYDAPVSLGTARTGPDLSNVGGRFLDEYHRRHHTNPRDARPGSLMPPFPWLNERFISAKDKEGVGKWLSGGMPYLPPPHVVDRRDPKHPVALDSIFGDYPYWSTAYKWGRQVEEKGRYFLYIYDPRRPEGLTGASPVGAEAKNGWRRATENDVLATYLQSLGTRKPMRAHTDVPDHYYYEVNSDTGQQEERQAPASISFAPRFIVQGRGIFMDKCAQCHGNNGDGNGPAGRDWIKHPANFTEKKFRDYPEAKWFWRVSEGVPGTEMPQWKLAGLSEDQRWWVIRYLQFVAKVDRKLISGTEEFAAEQVRLKHEEEVRRKKNEQLHERVKREGAEAVNQQVGGPPANAPASSPTPSSTQPSQE